MFLYVEKPGHLWIQREILKDLEQRFLKAEVPPTMDVCKLDSRYLVIHVDEDFEKIAFQIIQDAGLEILK